MTNYRLVRGMHDISGLDSEKFNFIIDSIKGLAKKFNFEFLSTPIVEYVNLFERNLGEQTDILSKELYKFHDRGGDVLALRPEFTASVARFLIENALYYGPFPRKYFTYGPVFRYDRPQKGRYRQFHQLNFEIFGCESNVQLLTIYLIFCNQILNLIGINDYIIEINHLGLTRSVRQNFEKELLKYFIKNKEELSTLSRSRLLDNPLRILDSKDDKDKALIVNIPSICDFYESNEQGILDSLCRDVENVVINKNLVRGLDYYTGFVFEITSSKLGSQSTIIAGGQYDNMISKMLDKNNIFVPAFGFAAGIERLMLLTTKHQVDTKNIISFLNFDNISQILNLIENIKGQFEFINGKNLSDAIKKANKIGSAFVVFINDVSNNIVFKNMQTSQEILFDSYHELIMFLEQKFK
jgi:histidyl-tRNA synthetase